MAKQVTNKQKLQGGQSTREKKPDKLRWREEFCLYSTVQISIDTNKYYAFIYIKTEKHMHDGRKLAKLMCLIGIIILEFGFPDLQLSCIQG